MRLYIKKAILFLTGFVIIIYTISMILPYSQNHYYLAEIDKRAMVERYENDSIILLIGGSNVAFGYNSEIIASMTGRKVVNGGVHASFGIKYMLDDIPEKLKTGDILILSPEYEQFYDDVGYGEGPVCTMYYVDGFHYPGHMSSKQLWTVIEGTPNFVRQKCEQNIFALFGQQTDPTYLRSSFNKYGDACWHWSHTRKHAFSGEIACLMNNEGFNEDIFQYVIKKLRHLQSRGVNIFLFPPVVESQSYKNMKERVGFISERLALEGFPFIYNPDSCAWTRNYFYDTIYHLNNEGAKQRSLLLGKLLGKRGVKNDY